MTGQPQQPQQPPQQSPQRGSGAMSAGFKATIGVVLALVVVFVVLPCMFCGGFTVLTQAIADHTDSAEQVEEGGEVEP